MLVICCSTNLCQLTIFHGGSIYNRLIKASLIFFFEHLLITITLLSKVIGPRPQGLWMGILTAAGSLARICGPIFVSMIYKEFGTYWTYGLTAISLAMAIAGTLATYTRLVPMQSRLTRISENSHL